MGNLSALRLAVIGCGEHSVTSLQPCIPLIPALDYVASCDLDPARAALGLRFGARNSYTDYRRMLAEEELDAAIVVGPATMHYEVGLACLEAGLHLFLEKPSAPTIQQARQLAEAARARGKFGMVGTMWRHAPAVRTQKRLSEESWFGRSVLFQGAHIAPGYHVAGPGGERAESIPWRFMLDQGSHMADCLRYLMGPVRTVAAVAPTGGYRENGVYLSALLGFASGATGTLTFASHAAVMSPSLTVLGDGGCAVTVSNLSALRVYPLPDDLSGGQHRAQTARSWEHGANYRGISRPGYLEELEQFASSILAGEQPAATLEDGWRALELCRALLESAGEGCTIELNQTS